MRLREGPLLFAIFLDLVGFGMAFPDLQLRAEQFRAPGWLIGLLLSSYFAVQMLASPRWGSLSDRIGRKPVLLACTALSSLSMVAYAFAENVWLILASRILAGLAAANVVVAQAYIADNTTEEQRAASMGRVGSAILIGLVAGPALGGELAHRGGNYLMGLCAAGASAMSLVWIYFAVEQQPPRAERKPGSRALLDLRLLRDVPRLRRIFFVSAGGWFALACLEGTFGRLIKHMFGLGQREFGWIFSYESLLGALLGLLMARIALRFASEAILRVGYLLQGVGLGLTPLAPLLVAGVGAVGAYPVQIVSIGIASTIYAIGLGLVNPTLNTVSSNLTPADRQGELFGLLQAARSAGFLAGPAIGGVLFDWQPAAPYALAAGVAVLAALLISANGAANPGTVRP